MKNKTITLIVAVNLAILVLLTIFSPELMISPGKPIDAHAELASDCFACHTPLIGSTPKKCIACHKVEEIGLKTTKGLVIAGEKKNAAFHQQLIEDDCVACGKCIKPCPTGAITGGTRKVAAHIDMDLCINCNACYEACGFLAIV